MQEVLNGFAIGFGAVLNIRILLLLILGGAIGTLTGAMPGLGPSSSIALLLPMAISILRELRATLKIDEDYLANVKNEKARHEKSASRCKELITALDTEYAEKQAFEQRIKQLEQGQSQTNSMLQEIIDKLNGAR